MYGSVGGWCGGAGLSTRLSSIEKDKKFFSFKKLFGYSILFHRNHLLPTTYPLKEVYIVPTIY
jgi:hypothetical protein